MRISEVARQSGSQLLPVQEALRSRVGNAPTTMATKTYALLDSMTEPFVDQIIKLLPESAKINRIGMVAPFFELDDGGKVEDAVKIDPSSIFGAFQTRAAKNVSLDVAIRWENAQLQREGAQVDLEDGLDQLWAWKSGDTEKMAIEYLVPTAITRATMKHCDHRGDSKNWDLQDALEAIEEGNFWRLPKPVAFAPRKSLKAAKDVYSEVRLWLHPAKRLIDGRIVDRPLHAKLLLVGFRSGSSSRTLVVMGSANMSRRALLQSVAGGGNVELGIAFVVDGEFSITDFLPEIVSVPMSLLELNEREFPPAAKNWSVAIDEAVHDPADRTLKISWSEQAAELPPWRLLYQEHELATAETPPVSPLTIAEFTLQPATAEVVLRVAEQDYSIPILVTDLSDLPVVAGGNNLGLKDLLLLLCRRIGIEQAIHRAQNCTHRDATELDEVFGTGFTPTDVFRAWWSVAKELQDASLSVTAFRLQLEGSLSAGYAWKCMVEALKSEKMDGTEVWFYGAELLRELDQVALAESPDREAKLALLETFKQRVQFELAKNAPADDGSKTWIKSIRGFYSGAKR